jgi:hypothetical protein
LSSQARCSGLVSLPISIGLTYINGFRECVVVQERCPDNIRRFFIRHLNHGSFATLQDMSTLFLRWKRLFEPLLLIPIWYDCLSGGRDKWSLYDHVTPDRSIIDVCENHRKRISENLLNILFFSVTRETIFALLDTRDLTISGYSRRGSSRALKRSFLST